MPRSGCAGLGTSSSEAVRDRRPLASGRATATCRRTGVGAAVVAVLLAAASCGSHDEPPTTSPATCRVELTSAGDQRIALIKVVREITGLGLKDSKDLVDAAPTTLRENLTPEAAREVVRKLEAAGATAELRPDPDS